jgi:hypothetical protein
VSLLVKRPFLRGILALLLALHGIAFSVAAAAHAPLSESGVTISAPGQGPQQASHDELRCPLCLFAVQQQAPSASAVIVADDVRVTDSPIENAQQFASAPSFDTPPARAPPLLFV